MIVNNPPEVSGVAPVVADDGDGGWIYAFRHDDRSRYFSADFATDREHRVFFRLRTRNDGSAVVSTAGYYGHVDQRNFTREFGGPCVRPVIAHMEWLAEVYDEVIAESGGMTAIAHPEAAPVPGDFSWFESANDVRPSGPRITDTTWRASLYRTYLDRNSYRDVVYGRNSW